MDKLKVCFVGIGSIAMRHIRNLGDICREGGIDLTIDALSSGSRAIPEDVAVRLSHSYADAAELPSGYDAIFITNPTELHLDALKATHDKARHFFIEKPVTSYARLSEAEDVPYRPDSVYYVACPLRYTNVIQYLKEHLNTADVICARGISSSYLPDWRPGVDYRDTYSAHKALGGGVSIDLIHEWDYLQYLFGEPAKIVYACGKKSRLEIDCEDYAVYIADYNDKIIELHLDYFGRKTIREIMIFTHEETIVADLIKSRISFLNAGTVIDFSEKRDDFQRRELRHFLGLLDADHPGWNSVQEACRTLNYTQGVVK